MAAVLSPRVSPSPPALPRLATSPQQLDPVAEANLRRFHLGDPSAPRQPPGEHHLPALLAEFRDASSVRHGYPLFLYAEDEQNPGAEPFYGLLQRQLQLLGPNPEQARVLKDNLPRLERILQRELAAPLCSARELLQQAGQTLQEELQLKGEPGQQLGRQLDQLIDALPAGGQLLSYGSPTSLALCLQTLRQQLGPRRAEFTQEVRALSTKLSTLLQLEWSKSAAARAPDAMTRSLGNAAAPFVDGDALAQLLGPSRGSRDLDIERHARIQASLAVLENFQALPPSSFAQVVYTGESPDTSALEALCQCDWIIDPDPCARARNLFEAQAEGWAEVFRAVRVARLELENHYDPQRHDSWFELFRWDVFSTNELLLMPPVIVVERAARVAAAGLLSFSRLLRSGMPVQLLLDTDPSADPGIASPTESSADTGLSQRLELGYLAMAHRHALVQQSSPARPDQYLRGLSAALGQPRSGVHLLTSGLDHTPVLPWLAAGAAIDSRAHSLVQIDPGAGRAWAERLTLADNATLDQDWPVYPLNYQDHQGTPETMELAFTYADFALLEPRLRSHFCCVPDGTESAAFIPLADYLSAATMIHADTKLPYIWSVDANGLLQRLLVSRELAMACRDRLDYWHTLQELAGIHNRHVELAVDRARAELSAKAQAEHQRLQQHHAAELEQVRRDAASEAMARLTRVLLEADLNPPQAPVSLPIPMDTSTAVVEALLASEPSNPAPEPTATASEAAPSDAAAGFDDPWIDTPLCSSCNDCISRNPKLFVYDANRQAVLNDPRGGSYAELVAAAEACPVRCIHPGLPLDPAEPNVDALIQRAAPFNEL